MTDVFAKTLAERINGGSWEDSQFYTDEQRELWRGHSEFILSTLGHEVESVAWMFRDNGDDPWSFTTTEPEICYEKRPLYTRPQPASTALVEAGKPWRVFEDITHGWWGIEVDGDNDADPILYPIKINRESLEKIVKHFNEALGGKP